MKTCALLSRYSILKCSILAGVGWEPLLVEADASGTAASIAEELLKPVPVSKKELAKESPTSKGELLELELLPRLQSTVAAWEYDGGKSNPTGGGIDGDGDSKPDMADWTASCEE